ncbi:hypothetical protein [Parasitella parasitica]|uniref:Uncharacterized protein n=1 Tax=Parasitella parasitica TaxID=35722 RepID=A0A0B7MXX7_9FUNG|nr:hypothetical protein [Parasitella parasitica]
MLNPTTLPPPPPLPVHLHQNATSIMKRNSETLSLDYDLSSSDDESDTLEPSYQKYKTEEHKFWQVHSSTTIISPPMIASDCAPISMSYVNPKLAKKHHQEPQQQKLQKNPAVVASLATQVQQILGSAFDEIDDEIENEWQISRTELNQTLNQVPSISLAMRS